MTSIYKKKENISNAQIPVLVLVIYHWVLGRNIKKADCQWDNSTTYQQN